MSAERPLVRYRELPWVLGPALWSVLCASLIVISIEVLTLPKWTATTFVSVALACAVGALLGDRPDVALAIAVTAGVLKGLVATEYPHAITSVAHNAIVALVALACLLRFLLERKFLPVWLVSIWTTVILTGLLRSNSLSTGLLQARELILPVAILAIGWGGSSWNWRTFDRILVVLAVAVAVAGLVELVMRRPPVSPLPNLMASGIGAVPTYLGLPQDYFVDGFGYHRMLRVGTVLLNPPAAGLFLASGLWAARRLSAHPLIVTLLLAGTVVTLARGGLVIALAVIALPGASRLLGRSFTGIASALVAGCFAVVLIQQGNTASHVNDLVAALRDLPQAIFGHGLGTAGYYAVVADSTASSAESFVAVAIASVGLPALLFFVYLSIRLAKTLHVRWTVDTLGAAAALLVICLTESAGALQATIPLWLLLGRTLGPPSDHLKDVPGAR